MSRFLLRKENSSDAKCVETVFVSAKSYSSLWKKVQKKVFLAQIQVVNFA